MSSLEQRAKDLFQTLIEVPTEQRRLLLDQSCDGNEELRQRVLALLKAYDEPDKVIRTPPPDLEPTTSEPPAVEELQIDSVIAGRYRILEKLPGGGMGVVYVAQQTQPYKRKVAVKLIKPGLDSAQVIARFNAERQALALLDHPNIAKVFDGGVTEQGRSFFVMEYIKGVSLTQYCDSHRLSIPDRLKLFADICYAVQHAHQKGIIHRDLKPSNILVALFDGHPVPKVIDFGLAKAMHQPLTDTTIHTGHGVVMGTYQYMSPEQAELNNLDIDTRTDIYALGVILYELLTGSPPLEIERCKKAMILEVLRLIREEEPPRPSYRLSSSASLPSIAAQRQIEPLRLKRLVQGDLDWIVTKALAKERNRRYETALGFMEDIMNYLANLPISARPPSTAYKLAKFYRRNRLTVIFSAALLALLVFGIIGTSLGFLQAVRSEKLATSNTTRANAINSFLETDLLRLADPSVQAELGLLVNKEIKLRDAVHRAGKLLLKGKLDDQPLVKASLYRTIGRTLLTLGDFVDAKNYLEHAGEIQRKELGDASPISLESRLDTAKALLALSQYEQAETQITTVTKVLEEHSPHHDELLLTGKRMLASSYQQQRKIEQARDQWQSLVDVCLSAYGKEHLQTGLSKAGLANATGLYVIKHQQKEAYKEVDVLFDDSLAILKRFLGEQHPDYIELMNNYAVFCSRKGELAKSESIYVELIKLYEAVIDPDHDSLLITKNNLATLYGKQNKYDEAFAMYKDVYEKFLKRYSAQSDGAMAARSGMAGMQFRKGDYASAEPIYREVLAIKERVHGPTNHDTNGYVNALAETLYRQNKFDEADKLFERVYQTNRNVSTPSEINLIENRLNIAKVRMKQGKLQASLPLLQLNMDSVALGRLPVWQQAVQFSMYAECLMANGDHTKAKQQALRSKTLFEEDKATHPSEYKPGSDRSVAFEALQATLRALDGK